MSNFKTLIDKINTDIPMFQDEPRLLSASAWMTSEAGPSTRGDFVASTIDVDAIKVNKSFVYISIHNFFKLFIHYSDLPNGSNGPEKNR